MPKTGVRPKAAVGRKAGRGGKPHKIKTPIGPGLVFTKLTFVNNRTNTYFVTVHVDIEGAIPCGMYCGPATVENGKTVATSTVMSSGFPSTWQDVKSVTFDVYSIDGGVRLGSLVCQVANTTNYTATQAVFTNGGGASATSTMLTDYQGTASVGTVTGSLSS